MRKPESSWCLRKEKQQISQITTNQHSGASEIDESTGFSLEEGIQDATDRINDSAVMNTVLVAHWHRILVQAQSPEARVHNSSVEEIHSLCLGGPISVTKAYRALSLLLCFFKTRLAAQSSFSTTRPYTVMLLRTQFSMRLQIIEGNVSKGRAEGIPQVPIKMR